MTTAMAKVIDLFNALPLTDKQAVRAEIARRTEYEKTLQEFDMTEIEFEAMLARSRAGKGNSIDEVFAKYGI
jgi:hypothetical protein